MTANYIYVNLGFLRYTRVGHVSNLQVPGFTRTRVGDHVQWLRSRKR